jgi:hypothetical protein
MFRIDLLVESRLVCELKAGARLGTADEAQLLNLLRATDLELGLLFHFGPKPAFRRFVASNEFKARKNSRRFAASAPFAAPGGSVAHATPQKAASGAAPHPLTL